MNKRQQENSYVSLMSVGFTLLFFGILLATILDVSQTLQVVGLVFIVASAAVFGASLKKRRVNKK